MSSASRLSVLHEAATSTTLLRNLRDPECPERFEASWREFYRKYAAVVVHWCEKKWGLSPQDADDLAAEVMTKVLRNIKTFRYRRGGSFRAWIFTVTRRAVIDFWKLEKRVRFTRSDQVLDRLVARDDLLKRLQDEFDLELLREARRRVAGQVSGRDWTIFVAVSDQGRDPEQVAGEHGVLRNNVYTIRARIVEKLRVEVRLLEQDGIGP